MEAILGVLMLAVIYVIFDFIFYVIGNKRLGDNELWRKIVEIGVVVGLPLLYIGVLDWDIPNDCCSDSATFSPKHRLTIYALIVVCMLAYFYSSYKKSIAPPLIEILLNMLLIIGIALNIVIGIHVVPFSVIGNFPITLLFVMQLVGNQRALMQYIQTFDFEKDKGINKIAWRILCLNIWVKFPVLLLLCLPVLMILVSVLLLFGQKPDSVIRAFTDTYKHSLSQLDHLCENVNCDSHFLCSVAAGGHQQLVKPQRLGKRGDKLIICNRQLLIANAFEEVIQERFPHFHRFIRHHYNKVGKLVHRYYSIFNNKYVADFVYIMMKPLEWSFLIFLYLFDHQPENRIAKQYTDGKMLKDKCFKANDFE